jgi:hypothetical protein
VDIAVSYLEAPRLRPRTSPIVARIREDRRFHDRDGGLPQVAVETRARSHDLGQVRKEAEYF